MKIQFTFSTKLTFLFLVSFLSFQNFSFGQNYFVPNDAHLLGLNQRNDFHFSGAISPNFGSIKITNLQLAYSPINHIGLSSSYFDYAHLENNPSVPKETINKNWDIAVGGYFFLPLVESIGYDDGSQENNKFFSEQNLSQRSGVMVDLYFGHSQGNIRNLYDKYGSSKFIYKKSYIQLGLHGTMKYFGFQFATRKGILNYVDGIVQGNSAPYVTTALLVLDSDNDLSFTEQFIRVHGGIKYGEIIFTFSRIKHTETFFELGVKNYSSTIGLQIDIDEFFRKNKNAKKI